MTDEQRGKEIKDINRKKIVRGNVAGSEAIHMSSGCVNLVEISCFSWDKIFSQNDN